MRDVTLAGREGIGIGGSIPKWSSIVWPRVEGHLVPTKCSVLEMRSRLPWIPRCYRSSPGVNL